MRIHDAGIGKGDGGIIFCPSLQPATAADLCIAAPAEQRVRSSDSTGTSHLPTGGSGASHILARRGMEIENCCR